MAVKKIIPKKKRKIKWWVLCFFFVGLNIFGFQNKILVLNQHQIFTDSCLFLACEMPPKTKEKRVVLMGNSVLQSSSICKEMLRLNTQKKQLFEMGNFAQTGASIADYIFMYQHIKQFKPDLLVVHLCPTTFGHNWPLFRTDIKKAIIQSEYRKFLDVPSIKKEYQRDDFVESLIYTYLPFYRYIPFIRASFKNKMNALCLEITDVPLMNFFHYNTNVLEEWLVSNPLKIADADTATQYEVSEELFIYFLKFLREEKQKTVFVMQENNFTQTPICNSIQNYFSGDPLFSYYDLRSFYHSENYFDGIHPNQEGAILAAERLFTIVEAHLKE